MKSHSSPDVLEHIAHSWGLNSSSSSLSGQVFGAPIVESSAKLVWKLIWRIVCHLYILKFLCMRLNISNEVFTIVAHELPSIYNCLLLFIHGIA